MELDGIYLQAPSGYTLYNGFHMLHIHCVKYQVCKDSNRCYTLNAQS